MSPDLDPARFKWVFYIDPVLFPFDNAGLAARNPDQALFMPNQTKLRQRFQQQAGLQRTAGKPSTTIWRSSRTSSTTTSAEGRSRRSSRLPTSDRSSSTIHRVTSCESIYAAYRRGGTPGASEYKAFQDFVFRYILVECGRLHLAVHIHSSAGTGDYFSVSGANVMNLENVLRDPRYVQTTFVLIHGGYPFEHQAITLASMPNVWLDSSATGSFVMFPDQFKQVLRDWLETYPDKITFGTDAFPVDEKMGVEEMYWMGVHNGRTALAAALAEMIVAREISESQAMAMAHGYLHDNAANPLQVTAPKLRRVLGFRDLTLFYIVTTLSPRWIATAAAAGPSALVIWVIAALGLFVPLVFTRAGAVVPLSGRGRHLRLEQARLRSVRRRS